MKNTEIFKLLKNFSPTDFVAFEKFLASPFHIKNKPLKVIFQILKDKNNLIIDSDYTKLRRIVKRKTAFSAATITKFTGNCLFRYSNFSGMVLSGYIYTRLICPETKRRRKNLPPAFVVKLY